MLVAVMVVIVGMPVFLAAFSMGVVIPMVVVLVASASCAG